MKKQLLVIPMIIGLNVSSNAEIQISISGHDKENISISTDGRGNKEYIYIDKDSHIVDSTIGTSISITSQPVDKKERIAYYKKKINRYEDKIYHYIDKIDKYEKKIIDKPKNRERYEDKIERYEQKIEESKGKIRESENKIAQYQKDK